MELNLTEMRLRATEAMRARVPEELDLCEIVFSECLKQGVFSEEEIENLKTHTSVKNALGANSSLQKFYLNLFLYSYVAYINSFMTTLEEFEENLKIRTLLNNYSELTDWIMNVKEHVVPYLLKSKQ